MIFLFLLLWKKPEMMIKIPRKKILFFFFILRGIIELFIIVSGIFSFFLLLSFWRKGISLLNSIAKATNVYAMPNAHTWKITQEIIFFSKFAQSFKSFSLFTLNIDFSTWWTYKKRTNFAMETIMKSAENEKSSAKWKIRKAKKFFFR